MTLKGALIGCGFFAHNHMQAWAELDGAQIIAVCDRDPVKAKAFAEAYGAKPFSDAATMLAEIEPDFTDIATTSPSHRPLVELAARHSRGAICQKPLAETLEDAEAMVAACATAGVPLLVHENFRWQAPIRAVIDHVRSGMIGKPHFLRLSFRHAFDIYDGQPYLAQTEDLALMDIGPHVFDMARALMGDVEQVYCQTQKLNRRVAAPDAFLAQLQHAGGGISSLECSFLSHYQPERFPQSLLVIEGNLGSIELLEGFRLRVHAGGTVSEFDVEPPVPVWGEKPWHLVQESVVAFQRHAIRALNGKEPGQPTGADNLKTFALTRAAIASAATGTAISLSHST
ncbi:Gfo/Idh/MocA family protein [Devosia submarina]|uniref:Gfo/Idh/MocA family protein n=1 Tax=Devosia submarina TaxID=1173082 RepID=UPI000D3B1A8C|nr:Gfo/Idh/MocA family oxidoreductase [Devosia submarina]